MPQDLSELLKEATKEVHTQAENAEFMKNFQKGELTREGFKVCGLEVPAFGRGTLGGSAPKAQSSDIGGDGCSGMLREPLSMFKGVILQVMTLRLREWK